MHPTANRSRAGPMVTDGWEQLMLSDSKDLDVKRVGEVIGVDVQARRGVGASVDVDGAA